MRLEASSLLRPDSGSAGFYFALPESLLIICPLHYNHRANPGDDSNCANTPIKAAFFCYIESPVNKRKWRRECDTSFAPLARLRRTGLSFWDENTDFVRFAENSTQVRTKYHVYT